MTFILPGGLGQLFASVPSSAWDPAHAYTAGLTFSNNNRTVTGTGTVGPNGFASVRALKSNTAGKLYFEVKITATDGSGNQAVGVVDSVFPPAGGFDWSSAIGGDTSGDSVGLIVGGSPRLMAGGSAVTVIGFGSVVAGDVYGVAVDFTVVAGKTIGLYFSRNGTWNNNNAPSTTLTTVDYTWSVVSGTFTPVFPASSLAGLVNASQNVITTAGAFANPPPPGYSAWGA